MLLSYDHLNTPNRTQRVRLNGFFWLSYNYRTPYSEVHPVTKSVFLQEFSDFLKSAVFCDSHLVITGDFNIHLDVVDDTDAIKLLGLLESIGLKQHVAIATHISKHTVDFIITRLSDKLAVCTPWTDYLFSDRMPIHCKCKVNKPAFKRSQISFRNIKSIDTHMLIAELQRANRPSEAPWVRKIGNPSSRENLVMTLAYERPSVRTSVQREGEGHITVTHTGN